MKIIYEDNCILVLDKPVGIVVNNSATSSSGTVQEFLKEKLGEVLSNADPESEFYLRSGILHRLDKDTSGILLVAKDPESFQSLKSQFMDRTITKEYRAVVLGGIDDEKIEINAPISRNPRRRMQMAVVKEGREAVTEVLVLRKLEIDGNFYTYIKAFPKTGRTHQIRVHLSALGHPVASDEIYCTRSEYENSLTAFPRMMLHAHIIKFVNPCDGSEVIFESELPEQFKNL